MTGFHTIPAATFGTLDISRGLIVDVRTDMEHAEKHLGANHTHVPLDQLDPDAVMQRHHLGKDSAVYLLCRGGKRAAQAAEKFVAAGYTNVNVIEGGLLACENCGHDIKGHGAGTVAYGVATTGPIPLERQVRIAAGFLAATGSLLALFVSINYIAIPLFIGCGLMFAGITDRCGLALVLTKAPWNKTVPSACCATKARQ